MCDVFGCCSSGVSVLSHRVCVCFFFSSFRTQSVTERVEYCKLNGHTNGSAVEGNGTAANGDAEKPRPATSGPETEDGEAVSSIMQVFRKVT